ncbi:MAG: OmcA/MtrC family decaheme c-type cytochrome, partial [Desulfobacteria bacterium]
IAVPYDGTLTHRVAMQVSDNVTNAIYDFRPDGIPVTTTRAIAMNSSCNECHVKLGFHGSDRVEVDYCVTCHNPGSTDANSGNIVDMKVMIHKIHRGEDLPSVEAGGEYTIWGYRDAEHDYSDVVHPQDLRNCTKCHDDATATPDGDNWKDVPTMEACGSCHDDVVFATGANHGTAETAQADNTGCTTCHPATGTVVGGKSVVEAHEIVEQVAAQSIQLNILDVSTAAGTGGALDVTIQFSVTDPLNSDLEYDIMDTDPLDLTPLSFLIGWDTTDITNTGSGRTPAQVLTASVDDATGDANNIFTLTVSDAVPAGVTGSGVVGLQGHPYSDQDGDGDIDDRIPVQSVFKSFAITDATAVDRRAVVDIDNCNECHQSLSLHGSNRTDEIQVCVMCHNPDATDVSVRPTDGTATTDGKTEEAIDMKYMIHAIHAADEDLHGFRENGIVVYGYRGSVNDFSHVRYPGNLNNCGAGHTGSTYEVPINENALPTTTKTGSDPAVPNDDTKITPATAVCSSCHDSLSARTHMTEEGGRFDLSYTTEEEADAGGPTGTQPEGHSDRTDCSSCHS